MFAGLNFGTGPTCVLKLPGDTHGWGQLKRTGINQFISGIGVGIGIERFWSELDLNEVIWASDIFVMLRMIFYRQLGVLLCRQWCLITKKSWTMNLLVKAINQWMKLVNGKSIRRVLMPCLKDCWLGTASKYGMIWAIINYVILLQIIWNNTKSAQIWSQV